MVADFEEDRILGEINDLEEEIELMTYYRDNAIPARHRILDRILNRLKYDKEHQERRLQIHRQQRKESGVKY